MPDIYRDHVALQVEYDPHFCVQVTQPLGYVGTLPAIRTSYTLRRVCVSDT